MTGLALTILLAAAPALTVGVRRGDALDPAPVAFGRAGEPTLLAVALGGDVGPCQAGRDGVSLRGRRCSAAPPAMAAAVRWVLAVPLAGDYDNTAACAFADLARGCHQPIHYREVELEALRGRLEVDASQVPALAAPGSHRLRARLAPGATDGGRDGAGPGDEPPASDATIGAWFELVVRRGDDYVGVLSELLGTPFALAPALRPGLGHQTDARLAADCVAVVIYGRRRLGARQPYLAPAALRERLTLVGRAPALVGAAGEVADVPGVRAGDVLHFGFQTAVLARDVPPVGRLDAGDVVLHGYHGLVEEVPLGRLPYREHPVEVLRWP